MHFRIRGALYKGRLLLDSRLIFCGYGCFCRFFAPKGLRNIAQGCREATTLGRVRAKVQPQRGCVIVPVAFPLYATPLGLKI
uniref:Uncharacterized protein n=1 Tax=Candidatus Kentrum sp. DK TaxID=2126562 RepID=A0A450STD1_9GAMM|nr:MAG: hypothetical protein BECKDK2373C_GA0170839_105814 [Candidatus Kentron sp. DK]VFJ60423.1 MAG: hypothetical protein BECKDK2373B_GA0170837_109211 [Candidatus Kentron sp. DK]